MMTSNQSNHVEMNEYSQLAVHQTQPKLYTMDNDTLQLFRGQRQNKTWSRGIADLVKQLPSYVKANRGLAISIFFLVVSTTAERVAFKMGVDLMIPYRILLAQAFVAISFIVYASITAYKLVFCKDVITPRMWQFPKIKLLAMAIIDALSFSGLVISAAGVTPTMTVILLHASTPVIVFLSPVVFPNRNYSSAQLRGSWFICFAVAISITRSLLEFYNGTELKSAMCSILYTACAALQGFGTLYKEKALVDWSQKLDIHFLSTWLFLMQFVTMFAMSPFLYHLQGVSSDWGDYPLMLNDFSKNLTEGWSCLFKFNGFSNFDFDFRSCPPQSGTDCGCDGSFAVVLIYVLANVVVLECINNVLQASNAMLGRAMTVSVLMAFIALGIYDNTMDTDVYTRVIGTIGYADILSMIALLVGIDYNGTDPEPNVEMITTYDPIEDEDGVKVET